MTQRPAYIQKYRETNTCIQKNKTIHTYNNKTHTTINQKKTNYINTCKHEKEEQTDTHKHIRA